jgi:quinol monooxygenase YgiN
MSDAPALLVLAEFGCSPDGDSELRKHLERTLAETRATPGCLQATLWERPAERRYLFTTYWTDAAAVTRWVENDFHRKTLMPGFRRWCVEGSFSEFSAGAESARPGWSERGPTTCRQCGAAL